MKETTFFVKKIIDDYENMDAGQKEELSSLLELNDQELFDLIFKNKELFIVRFPQLKKFAN